MPKHKKKRVLVESKPVNDYITIHPALDFWDEDAIVSIGSKWQKTFSDGDIEFDATPLCVTASGDSFEYDKKELAKKMLFYRGSLDVPTNRWEHPDIEKFKKSKRSPGWNGVYKSIQDQFKYYMDFSDDRLYVLFPCFVIYTYFYPLFANAPIIQLWGEFATGKTKICALLEAMAFNPINSSNLTGATVFRQIQSSRSVVLLDESEDLSNSDKAKDIRNMLLAGTGKSGKAYRQEKQFNDNFRTATFEVFSPKVIANIAGISIPALQSRTIQVSTVGASNKEKINREVDFEAIHWQHIRNYLYRIVLCRFKEVILARDRLKSKGFSGRTLQIWKGLFAISSLIGKEEYNIILKYAQENKDHIDADTEAENDRPRQLAESLLKIINRNNGNCFYTSEDLMYLLSRDIALNSKRDLGMMLGRLGLKSKCMNRDGNTARYYVIEKNFVERLVGNRSL